MFFRIILLLLLCQIVSNTAAQMLDDSIVAANYHYFPKDFLLATKANKWGVYHKDSQKLIVSPEYDYIYYQEPYFLVQKSKKWGVADSLGQMKRELLYDSIIIGQHVYGFMDNQKWYLTDTNFNYLTQEGFDDFLIGLKFIALKKEERWSIWNIKKAIFEDNCKADDILRLPHQGLFENLGNFWIRRDKKWSLCNISAPLQVKIDYDSLTVISTNEFKGIAFQDEKCYVINLFDGNKLSAPFDSIKIEESQNLWVAYKKSKACILNQEAQITPVCGFDNYDTAFGHKNNLRVVLIQRNNKWAIVNTDSIEKKPIYKYLSIEVELKDSELKGTTVIIKAKTKNGKIDYIECPS